MPDEKKPKKKSPTVARPASAPDEVAAAYARMEKDIDALPSERVGRVTADIPTAVSLALGALPAIESLADAMGIAFKRPPTAEIARLRDRALAALFTHLHYVPKSTALDAELEEARVLRERLLASADAHVAHGHLDAAAVAQVREGAGHLDRANDLIALAALFRASEERIAGKTQVTGEQLDRATVLGTVLVAALGGRALGTGAATGGASWADRRTRAFRLFVEDYDQIRRAVEFVRFDEDDANAFAPPLHTRRSGGSAKAPPELVTPSAEGGSVVGNG